MRINAYVVPFGTCVAFVPFGSGQSIFIPIDDENCWRYSVATQPLASPRDIGGPGWASEPNWSYGTPGVGGHGRQRRNGIAPRRHTAENDYSVDRDAQKTVSYTGIPDFGSQDMMVTETMGPIYDRSLEHLGTTDVAIIRMRRLLIDAAKGLTQGKEPPALAGVNGRDFRNIRSAEKILEPGADWRILGANEDPLVQEALLATDSER